MSDFCSESNAKAVVADLASGDKQLALKKFMDCLGDRKDSRQDVFMQQIARAQHPKAGEAPWIDLR